MKAVLKAVARRLGYEVARSRVRRRPHDESRRLVLVSSRIDVVFDIGANEGLYAGRLRELGYTGRIISFEPQAHAFAKLAEAAAGDELWEVRQVAVGAQPGSAELHVGAQTTTSSLLPVGAAFARHPSFGTVGTETVEVVRLDDVAEALLAPHERLFLKVDVQGLELTVLRAAPRTVARAAAAEIELPLTRIYDGEPHYLEVLHELEEAGLRLVSAEPGWIDPVTGHGIYLDAIAVRAE